jgi:hypothetical protein
MSPSHENASAACPQEQQSVVRADFYVTAASDPGMLPRIVEPVSKLGFVPARVHASSEDGDGSELAVELRLRRLPQRAAQQIEAALRAIVGVRQVVLALENDHGGLARTG